MVVHTVSENICYSENNLLLIVRRFILFCFSACSSGGSLVQNQDNGNDDRHDKDDAEHTHAACRRIGVLEGDDHRDDRKQRDREDQHFGDRKGHESRDRAEGEAKGVRHRIVDEACEGGAFSIGKGKHDAEEEKSEAEIKHDRHGLDSSFIHSGTSLLLLILYSRADK